jgi:hypothetical protein
MEYLAYVKFEIYPSSSNIFVLELLGIHDLFGTELAMIFSFHVGLTDSVMQRMQFFFPVSVCSTFSCHPIAIFIILIFVRN